MKIVARRQSSRLRRTHASVIRARHREYISDIVSSFRSHASPPSIRRWKQPTDRWIARAPALAGLLIYNPRSALQRSINRACRCRVPPHTTRVEDDDASDPRAHTDVSTHTITGRTNERTERTNERSIDHACKKTSRVWDIESTTPGTARVRARTHESAHRRITIALYTYRRSRQRRAGAERRRTVRHHDVMG